MLLLKTVSVDGDADDDVAGKGEQRRRLVFWLSPVDHGSGGKLVVMQWRGCCQGC